MLLQYSFTHRTPCIVHCELIRHRLLYVHDENYNTCRQGAQRTKGKDGCITHHNTTYNITLANYSHPYRVYVFPLFEIILKYILISSQAAKEKKVQSSFQKNFVIVKLAVSPQVKSSKIKERYYCKVVGFINECFSNN